MKSHREFQRQSPCRFLASLMLSRLADQVLLFLVPLVIFQSTRSVGWSGLVFALEMLPRLLFVPLAGFLCDRVSPLRLLHISQAWRALACIGAIGGYWAWCSAPYWPGRC